MRPLLVIEGDHTCPVTARLTPTNHMTPSYEEVGGDVLLGDGLKTICDGLAKCSSRTRAPFAHEGLELGEHVFDRVAFG